MKFLMYSQSGEGAQLLKAIEQEGNEVSLFIKDEIYKTVFNGILPKTETPDDFIDDDTIIIFDMSGDGHIADKYKHSGHLVYGASAFADDLEHDRNYGFKAMKEAGIKIPDYKEFKTFKDGREYAKSSDKRLVFKPTGSMPKKLTYCSKNNEELIAYLNFVEKQFGKQIDNFILQEFIEGTVVSSEFFCNENGFVYPPNHTVEVKKSMNDELGPSTGCSGNITWPCEDDGIIDQGVGLIEELCKKHNYVGQIDLNSVVNDSGVYGLEWTPRMGYDATPTLLSLWNDEYGKFFSDFTRGQLKELPVEDMYAGAVRLTIPPYPAEPKAGIDSEKFSPNLGIPILGIDEYEKSCYFYEIEETELGLCHSGGTGIILIALGYGSDPRSSLDEPYNILKEVVIPDKQYRTDLKEILPKEVKEVEKYAA